MFVENIFKKRHKKRHIVTNRIRENNLIEHNKIKLLKGEIILTHCRGHDTIMIFFCFEGFHEQHIPFIIKKLRF